MHTIQFCQYLREVPGEHTYLAKKTGIFPGKNYKKNSLFLYYKNKATGDIFEQKGISE